MDILAAHSKSFLYEKELDRRDDDVNKMGKSETYR